ncbi:DoxX family protein [Calycomorphotria hydatis]|uniref:DoxX n=1 Tax=Calycomorphotria hydatis TaxID=2528027 RepID=A0A517T6V4_9PLAN|nr:DoxX family protein [Calycomorphotria hydatis]QDT64106.1 hypothetical protein V22_13370 [Calycomorphotria hydatis]
MKMKIAGWVMSVLTSLFLIGASASGKFLDWEGKEEMFDKFGYSIELMKKVGIVEVALAILLLIPRAGFIAAILLTAYLGGAVSTHVRVNDPFIFPIIVGVFMWIGVGLRYPDVFQLAIGNSSHSAPTPQPETDSNE